MKDFKQTRFSLLLLFENDSMIQPKSIIYDNYNNEIYNLSYKFPDWRYAIHFCLYDYYSHKFGEYFEKSYDVWTKKYCEFNEIDDEYEYNMNLDEFYNFKSNKEIPYVETNIGNIFGNKKISDLDAHNFL